MSQRLRITQSDPFDLELPASARVVGGQVFADLSAGDAGSAQDVYGSLTSSGTFAEGVNTVLCDATSGELTVTLPDSVIEFVVSGANALDVPVSFCLKCIV